MILRILFCSIVVLMSSGVSLTSIAHSETVPQGAADEAQRYLDAWLQRAEKDPAHFRWAWGIQDDESDFSQAQVDDPYISRFLRTEDVLVYARDEQADDILAFAISVKYAFPIINRGRFIGTILVAKNQDEEGQKVLEEFGEYAPLGRHRADDSIDNRILELRHDFPRESGYSISMLSAAGIGEYLFIRSPNNASFVTPVTEKGAYLLSLSLDPPRTKSRYELLPIDLAVPILKKAAKDLEFNVPLERE